MLKYDLIFIDADDTLFDFHRAEQFALVKLFEQHHIPLTEWIISKYTEINNELWVQMEQGKINQEQIRVERFAQLIQFFGWGLEPKGFSDDYLKWLGKGVFLCKDAVEICAYLSERYTLVIMTNGFKEVQMSRLADSEIVDFIEHIIISEDAKHSKPHLGIFEYALEQIGHYDKSRICIIGDSLTSDIQGGINFGIDTCWLNNGGQLNKTTLRPTYEINGLIELKGIL